MKPPVLPATSPATAAPSGLGAGHIAAATGVATVLAAGVGYGLQHSLPVAGWAGAAIAGTVAALLTPALLWVRPARVANLARLALVKPAEGNAPAPVVPLNTAALPRAGLAPGVAEAQASARDALTGAYTQQHFVAAADREWSRIRRHGEDAALLMIEIDHLGTLNDRHSRDCGDAVLVEVTRQVSATLRQYDLLSRFNGGVLVVYLPHTDPIGALDVAERIRERVAHIRLSWQTELVKATVSVGVAGIGAAHGALDEVIADAGTALREAKAAGRNCVRAAPIPPRRQAGNGQQIGAGRPTGPL
jgi:diguanylate cyclase (GGDEF)-like protein